jgi:hypothetical protein
MKKESHKEIVKRICDFMGEDLDAPACQEVAAHVEKCPECKIYLDTIKKTVTLCRDLETSKKLPSDVNHRLFKVLDLERL